MSTPILNDRDVVGAAAIASRLECSTRAMPRWWKDGVLPARKGAGRTSPLKAKRSDLDAFKADRS